MIGRAVQVCNAGSTNVSQLRRRKLQVMLLGNVHGGMVEGVVWQRKNESRTGGMDEVDYCSRGPPTMK